MLPALLLIPVVGSLFSFFGKSSLVRRFALSLSILEMILSFYIFLGSDFSIRGDENFQYEFSVPFFDAIQSQLHFGIDGMGMLFILLTNILVPIILLSSFNQEKKFYGSSFYALVLLMQFGLLGLFSSLDAVLFYVFWELTLLPIWFICGIWGEEGKRLKVTKKFFVYTFSGSLFMLVGLIYIGNQAPSFSLLDFYKANLSLAEQEVMFWLIFIAFAIKLPIFPFHTWQPDTYTYSPTQGSMLLSGIMLKMAVFGLLRFLLPVVPEAIGGVSGKIVLTLSLISILYGALIAIVENDIKRIIAFSSLSHVGLMIAGIFSSAILTVGGSFTYDGSQGAMIQSFAHGINVVGLFYCADILFKKFNTRDISKMGGLAKVMPKFSVLFMIILLGSMAVPLTNGFIGEFILLKSIFEYSTLAVFVSGMTLILGVAYSLRMYGKAMFGKGNPSVLSEIRDLSCVEFTVLLSLSTFVILLGIFPGSLLKMLDDSLKFIHLMMVS